MRYVSWKDCWYRMRGIILVFVFISAIAHLEFSGHRKVLVWQAQKDKQGFQVPEQERDAQEDLFGFVWFTLSLHTLSIKRSTSSFFLSPPPPPPSTCFKNKISPLQQVVMMTLWFKSYSYLQHGKVFGLIGKHLCPEVAERACFYVNTIVLLLLNQEV